MRFRREGFLNCERFKINFYPQPMQKYRHLVLEHGIERLDNAR